MSTTHTEDARFLRGVLGSVDTAVVVVDESGTVVLANEVAEGLLGRAAEALSGRPLDKFIAGDWAPPEFAREPARSDGGSTTDSRALSLVHADGHRVPVRVHTSPVEHEGTRYATLSLEERTPATTPASLGEHEVSGEFSGELVEASTDGLLVIDPEADELLDYDDRACDLLGCDHDELAARPPSAILPRSPASLVNLAGGKSRGTDTFDLDSDTDDGRTVAFTASLVRLDRRRCLLVHLRDATGCRERAARLTRRSAAVDTAFEGIAILDEDCEFVYANPAHAEMHGYESPSELVGESWERLYGPDEVERFRWDVLPTVRERGEWRGEAIGHRTDETEFPQELSISRLDDGGYVCVVRDRSDRQRRVQRLELLNEASRELSLATGTGEITRIGAETATELLGTDVACIRLFDAETGQLEPAAMTGGAEALVESRPAFDLKSSLAGRAFRSGEPVVERPDADDPFVEITRCNVHLPLGEHGTLTVFLPEDETLTDVDLRLAETLAETVAADLERAERERDLRESERTIREQRNRLGSLNRMNNLVQDLIGELIEASTREKLEQRICERLAASDRYRSAWIAEVDVNGDLRTLKASAGLDEEYRTLLERLPIEQVDNGVVRRVEETREFSVTSDYRVDGPSSEDSEEESRVDSTAAVPLEYDDRLYGVLVLKADAPDAFEAEIESGLAVLGDAIGFAIHAVENRRLLLSDEVVELEFEVTDTSCLAVAVSEELGCYAAIEQAVLTQEGDHLCYLKVENVEPEDAKAVTAEAPSVTECRVVDEHDDGCLLEVRKTESGAEAMLDVGATIRAATADDGIGTLVVEAPQSADVREVIDRYTARNPQSSLRAKREVNRPARTTTSVREHLDEHLTEKQESALKAAYYAGYYDWPRRSTAEELADSLGVASATLHQHLRKAEGKLLSALVEEDHAERADAAAASRQASSP